MRTLCKLNAHGSFITTTFTLDTNCLYDLEDQRASAAAIEALIARHRAGAVQVAVVAISASENQPGGTRLEDFADFESRLQRIGIADLEILKPLGYWDVDYWDRAVWGTAEIEELSRNIHEALFPGYPFLLEHCIASIDDVTKAERDWINRHCDVQAMWSHISHRRDVFVTNDKNFHKDSKKPKLVALGAGRILRPDEAMTYQLPTK